MCSFSLQVVSDDHIAYRYPLDVAATVTEPQSKGKGGAAQTATAPSPTTNSAPAQPAVFPSPSAPHQFHAHPLRPRQLASSAVCAGCTRPIGSDQSDARTCADGCDFVLCADCVASEVCLFSDHPHPLHHALVGFARWKCGQCLQQKQGYGYACVMAGCDLHVCTACFLKGLLGCALVF